MGQSASSTNEPPEQGDVSMAAAGDGSSNQPQHDSPNEEDNDDVIVTGVRRNELAIPLSLEELVKLHSTKTIRFSASDVAAMTGFHPYKNLPVLLQRLVYQGRTGAALLKRDSQALQLTLVASEEEIWKSLAAQAGPTTQKALETVLKGKTSTSVQQAQELKQQVVEQAKASGKLNPTELKVLQEGARHTVNTRFGCFHEDNALDLCEKKYGWEIFQRNAEVLEWPFQKMDHGVIASCQPMGEATTCWKRFEVAEVSINEEMVATEFLNLAQQASSDDRLVAGAKRQKLELLEHVVDLTGNGDSDSKPQSRELKVDKPSSNNNQFEGSGSLAVEVSTEPLEAPADTSPQNDLAGQSETQHQYNKPTKGEAAPFFVIRGSVDGIRDELTPISSANAVHSLESDFNDDDSWVMRPVVVELKHRMNRIFHFPPLYEQIQAVAYCFMYKVENADIVQVIRQEIEVTETIDVDDEVENNDPKSKQDEPKEGKSTTDIQPVGMKDFFPIIPKPNNNDGETHASLGKSEDRTSEGAKGLSEAAIAIDSAQEKSKNNDESSDAKAKLEQAAPKNGVNGTIESEKGSSGLHVQKQQQRRTRRRKSKQAMLQADRIALDDPTYQHRQHWNNVILPRLRSFADAVYAIRKDDSKRYRLLQACSDPLGQLEKDAWELLHNECAWLKDCDTAFNRDF